MLYALRRVNAIPDDWIRIDPPFAANAPCNASTPPETSPTAVSNKRPTTSDSFRQNAVQAVNTHLTVRNWLIGFYIVEFEQNGEDRAKYGAKLLQNLADGFNEDGLSYRNLNLYRKFYNAYPQVSAYVPEFLQRQFGGIMQTVSAYSQALNNQ